MGCQINASSSENGDIQIEISNMMDHEIYKIFEIIGFNQIQRGNIRKVKGTCIKDKEKKLYFVIKEEQAVKSISTFAYLMDLLRDDVFKSQFLSGIYKNIEENDEYPLEGFVGNDLIETLFLLEESGTLSYDIDAEEILIEISGMKPILEFVSHAEYILSNIQNDPKISNIFAKDGPPQDLSNKIHNDEDARKAAKTFSEGRKSLEDLLYFCFKNNITTYACCAGHEKDRRNTRGLYCI